ICCIKQRHNYGRKFSLVLLPFFVFLVKVKHLLLYPTRWNGRTATSSQKIKKAWRR
ncbi:unnamed protein product, partial [Amoebophrya sp. A25]